VVVVAAGSGRRFGGTKQFASLGGRPLVAWSVEAARSVADGIVLVVPAPAADAAADAGRWPDVEVDVVVTGGATRSASVAAGVAAVPASAGIIVVHDGARPLAPAALFQRVVEAVVAGAPAVVPGLPMADTVKEVDDAGVVLSTPARHRLVAVQTPQAFRADVLRAAHASGGEATDDAGLVEARGTTVRVVPGEPRNVKVTTPADLELARALTGR